MVTCTTVRDLLPEHALGVAGSLEGASVDRHLSWCAACRKEARDLGRAAATFAFALPPADPEPELEDVVRGRIRALARPPRHRGRRRAGTILLAAAIASATFAGVALSDRSSREEQLAAENDQNEVAIKHFADLIRQSEFADPETEAFLGTLTPAEEGGTAGGSALTIMAPSVDDQVMVIVAGLPSRERRLPYRVTLRDAQGHHLAVGRIRALDSGGGATVARIVEGSLGGFVYVVIRDAHGRNVLDGMLSAPATIASPSA